MRVLKIEHARQSELIVGRESETTLAFFGELIAPADSQYFVTPFSTRCNPFQYVHWRPST